MQQQLDERALVALRLLEKEEVTREWHITYLQQMAMPRFLPTTLCRYMIRTHISRVAPDWDI